MCGTTGEMENVRRVIVRDVSNKDLDNVQGLVETDYIRSKFVKGSGHNYAALWFMNTWEPDPYTRVRSKD